MCENIVIIGAGGHGKVVADIARKSGYKNVYFVDDIAKGACLGHPVIGTTAQLNEIDKTSTEFFIAVGNNDTRRSIAEKYDLPWATLIHPSAVVGEDVVIGKGTAVMANAVINPSAKVGEHCIINTAAVIEHDNALDSFVHVSPKAALGGTVFVGNGTHIGIGATVKNNVGICENCVIGAGAVVVKDIRESGVYIGIPAKKVANS